MNKTGLANSLFEGIPENLRAMLGGQLGNFSTLTEPSTEEDAVIVAGKMCVEVQNKLLVPLSGLPVVDALLYIGSLNPAVMAGMFSGLESSAGAGPFDIIAPKDGGIYPGFFDAWTVRADVEAISVDIEGVNAFNETQTDTFELRRNDDVWTAKYPIANGSWTATFSDGTNEQSVSFSVVSWDTYPVEGGEYQASEIGSISVDFNGGGQDVDMVSVQLFGQAIDLMSETVDLWKFEGINPETIVEGAHNMVIMVSYATGGIIQSVVEFFVTGETGN